MGRLCGSLETTNSELLKPWMTMISIKRTVITYILYITRDTHINTNIAHVLFQCVLFHGKFFSL